MTDLSGEIRLAVDSGVTALGINEVIKSIREDKAKLVIAATSNKETTLQDVVHLAKVANLKVTLFEGNPIELGAICGKPYSVSVMSVIEPGNSSILNDVNK